MIEKKSYFGNNTSASKAALFVFEEDMPWLRVEIRRTTFNNNFGSITNDIYAKNIKRLSFIRSNWT